jgi:DNA-binding beta-propeller fold protein YncE
MRWIVMTILVFSVSAAEARRQAYVVNNLAETLSIIDLETGQVENHVVALGETPNQVVWHDGFLYVVNSISADIMKIDPDTRQIVADIYLPIGSNPYFMATQGDYAYVTAFVSGKVYRIDIGAGQVDGEIEIGGYPEGIICAGDRIYVTQTYFNPDDFTYGQGKLAIIDIAGFTYEGQVDIGTNPQWISDTGDGSLHIVCTGNYADIGGTVYLFDHLNEVVADSINIGGQPANLAVSPLEIGYLAAGGWFDRGQVFAYDIETGEIINGPENPIYTGLGVTWVAVDSLGYLYSCDMGDDTVTKLSPTGEFITSFHMGDGPISMTIYDGTQVGTDPENADLTPDGYFIITNYPNPFNGGTFIEYGTAEDANNKFVIEIYDILGRRIKSIAPGTAGGLGKVYWDGNDDWGRRCSSGIYLARMIRVGEEKAGIGVGIVRKIVHLK